MERERKRWERWRRRELGRKLEQIKMIKEGTAKDMERKYHADLGILSLNVTAPHALLPALQAN